MSVPPNTVDALVHAWKQLEATRRQSWITRFFGQFAGGREQADFCASALACIRELEQRQQHVSDALSSHDSVLQGHNHSLLAHAQTISEWEARRERLNELSAQVSAVAASATITQSSLYQLRMRYDEASEALTKRLADTATQLGELSGKLSAAEAGQSGLREDLTGLQSAIDSVRDTVSDLAVKALALGRTVETHVSSTADVLTELQGQQGAAAASLAELLREKGPEDPEEFSRFYLAFEDRFRGSREDIAQRMGIYIPHVLAAMTRTQNKTWVDLGCGRGEWLEILRDQGAAALGVDNNSAMLRACRERGLTVVADDALEFLDKSPSDSFAGVTGFHIIEHLPYRTMLTLFRSAFRVLAPGGCLIFETPNPQNVSVGACNFYMDVTHHKPIPPMTAEFIAQHAGFKTVEVLRLHPSERHAERDSLPTVTEREYCEMFYGPRDYAIVAVK